MTASPGPDRPDWGRGWQVVAAVGIAWLGAIGSFVVAGPELSMAGALLIASTIATSVLALGCALVALLTHVDSRWRADRPLSVLGAASLVMSLVLGGFVLAASAFT